MRLQRAPSKHFRIDKELVIVFLLVAIAGTVFFFCLEPGGLPEFLLSPRINQRLLLRQRPRHSVSSALDIACFPDSFILPFNFHFRRCRRVFPGGLDVGTWASFLIITALFNGAIYTKKKESATGKIKKTYQGIIEMMSAHNRFHRQGLPEPLLQGFQ